MRQCSFAYVLFTFGYSGAYLSPACSIYGYPQIFMAGEGGKGESLSNQPKTNRTFAYTKWINQELTEEN
jgi:hypothetical protein